MGDEGEPAEETEREPAAYQEEAGEPREEGALPVRRGGDAVLGDPRGSARATAAQSRPQAPPFPAAPGCVLPCPARLCGPKLDSPFQSFFFPITILTILKCEASCVFSISTVSYNHHRSLTPERFRHPQKKPGTPCSCSQFPRTNPWGPPPCAQARWIHLLWTLHVDASVRCVACCVPVSGFFPLASGFPGSFPSSASFLFRAE